MNIERLTETAEWLEAGAPERRFNMNRLFDAETADDPGNHNWCGTECCIAGYVVTRYAPTKVDRHNIEKQARELLGLNYNLADALFYPRNIHTDQMIYGRENTWDAITPAQAAVAVRNVIKHNDPKWEEILK
jgi:hypothetical protein